MSTGIDLTGIGQEVAKAINEQTKSTDQNTQSTKKNITVKIQLVNTEKKLGNQVKKSTKKLKDQENHTRNLHGTFSVLRSKLLLASFAFRSFQQTLGSTVKETGAYNAAQARLLQGIKNSGNVMSKTTKGFSKWAGVLQQSTGISDTMIINNMALMSTFQKVNGTLEDGSNIYEKSIEAILDYTAAQNFGVVTTENLRSATIQVGKALNDPIKGYTALARNGVVFSKAQVRMIEAFQETGQLAKAQGVILKELNKEFGGTASLDTYERSMRLLGTAFGDLQKKIGVGLGPAFKQMAEGATVFINAIKPSQIAKMARSLGQAYAILKLWSIVAPVAAKSTKKLGSSFRMLGKQIPSYAFWVGINYAVLSLMESFEDLDDAAERLSDTEGDLSEENRKLLETFTGMTEETQRIEFKKLVDELEELSNKYNEVEDATPDLGIDPSQISLATESFTKLKSGQLVLIDVNRDFKEQLQESMDALRDATPLVIDLTKETDNETTATLSTKAAMEQSNASRLLEIGRLREKIRLLRELLGITEEDTDAIHNTSKNVKDLTKIYKQSEIGKLETINTTKELIENMKAEAEAYEGTDKAQIERNKNIIHMAEIALPKLTEEAEKAQKEIFKMTFAPGVEGFERDIKIIGEGFAALGDSIGSGFSSLYEGDWQGFKEGFSTDMESLSEGFATMGEHALENFSGIADGVLNLGAQFSQMYADQLSAIEDNMNAENDRWVAQQKLGIASIRSDKKRAKAEAQLEADLAVRKLDVKKKMASHRLKEVDINFYTSVMRAFAENHWAVALLTTVMLNQTRQTQKAGIRANMQFAKGGSFITGGPTPILVGDNAGGKERVDITPLSSPNIDGPSGASVVLNVSAPLVDEHRLDTIIPKINEAVSGGAELRSSHTDFAEDRLG